MVALLRFPDRIGWKKQLVAFLLALFSAAAVFVPLSLLYEPLFYGSSFYWMIDGLLTDGFLDYCTNVSVSPDGIPGTAHCIPWWDHPEMFDIPLSIIAFIVHFPLRLRNPFLSRVLLYMSMLFFLQLAFNLAFHYINQFHYVFIYY